jgi:capsular polysaccharide export protein
VSPATRHFTGKKVALLQGPVGPFFRRLAEDLRCAGAEVLKINFNGGDLVFYPNQCTCYTGDLGGWKSFFQEFIATRGVEAVILFGDCRPIHRVARQVADSIGLEVWVFEEGYIRPDYVTFERGGVNARSGLPRDPTFYLNQRASSGRDRESSRVGNAFAYTALWAMIYYFFGHLFSVFFRSYEHHRPLVIWEGLYWLRGFWRRFVCRFSEAHVLGELTGSLRGRFFLTALQVHVDSQISVHSDFESVDRFIDEVVDSFAVRADEEDVLVFKHHPLDRGYHDYGAVVRRAAERNGIARRVKYIHDQPLPAMLDACKGVVVINSTVGLSAVHHGCPVKVCGKAIYDMPGLTFQGELDDFWCSSFKPDGELYQSFRAFLLVRTQLNGNFYRRLENSMFVSGIDWGALGLRAGWEYSPGLSDERSTVAMG